MRVAIYTRVSGKSNRQDAANQSHQLIEYCQRQGWQYVEYTDRMSGTRADREQFLRLFGDARLKHFDLVLFWALDRFSREGTLKTLEYLQWRGVEELHGAVPGQYGHVSRCRHSHPRDDREARACTII
jgi:DNA invertase Pin-like site-specific DNA recombinase